MPEKVNIERGSDDLIGAAEVAAICKVPASSVSRWRKAQEDGKPNPLPEPVAKLKATWVWLRSEIEQMARDRA